MTIDRDWSEAVAHHEGKRCRVCLAWPRELAHVIPRKYDWLLSQRTQTGRVKVHPLAVVPLCAGHHKRYDSGQLDLTPHLKREELEHAFSVIGEIAAMRYVQGRRDAALYPR